MLSRLASAKTTQRGVLVVFLKQGTHIVSKTLQIPL